MCFSEYINSTVKQDVRMVVDHCASAITTETITSTSSDRSTCEVSATINSNTFSFADFSSYNLKLGLFVLINEN